MTETELFEWARNNQDNGKLAQPQVDGIKSMLVTMSVVAAQTALSNIMGWSIAPGDKRAYSLDINALRKIHPKFNAAAVPILWKYAPEYGITSKKQMASFIASCTLESNGLYAIRESFAYSPLRLHQVFPTRVVSVAAAKNLISKGQIAVANFLYGGRYGNRPGTNDGWDYRGGGIKQNTFRDNYFELQIMTGIAFGDNPKLIEDLENSVRAAMAFWKLHGCNDMAEKINTYANGYTLNTLNSKGVETKDYKLNYGARLIRKAVNGGYNGYEEFCQYLEKALQYL